MFKAHLTWYSDNEIIQSFPSLNGDLTLRKTWVLLTLSHGHHQGWIENKEKSNRIKYGGWIYIM